MAIPTNHLRHVWRTVYDENGALKVLTLQQWYEAERGDHPVYVKDGGFWRDVEISTTELNAGPTE